MVSSLLISCSVSVLDILCDRNRRTFVKANSMDSSVRKMFRKQILDRTIIRNKLEEPEMTLLGRNLLSNVKKKWNNVCLFKKKESNLCMACCSLILGTDLVSKKQPGIPYVYHI